MLIQNNSQLKQFSQECQKDKIIAVDTEFFWTDTYSPIPCLIQIANKKRIVLIDLIETNLDLSFIKILLYQKDIIKIFHSARQDLEVFFNLFKEIPNNIFDTQIALHAINTNETVSLEKMYKDLLNVNISKLERRIDWRNRPLTFEQTNYATNDVKYLIKIYNIIFKKLKSLGRLKWVLELHNKIFDKKIFLKREEIAWKKIRFQPMYKNELFLLKKISKLREIEAKKKNVPIKKILSNSDIIKLSKKNINKDEKVKIVQKINNLFLQKKIMSLLDKKLFFKVKIKSFEIDSKIKEKVKKARTILNQVSNDLKINPSIIANKQDLIDLFLGKKSEIFHGWKYKVFGKKLKEDYLI